ncbi:MAG: hypothetical protein HYU88_13865 [Chloroflexi bacterium]|nr:hypothetical protein [Chloroflexota bacterium]
MVDTSADRTVLAPLDAARVQRELGMDLTTLPEGQPSIGVGGQMNTRTLEAILTLDTFSAPLTLTILQPVPGPTLPIPSLLGRDILAYFALFLEELTDRVLLLDPSEVDTLALP